MKQYTKPTVSVVELAVKENIAKLPDAIANSAVVTKTSTSNGTVLLTTYNLAAASDSVGGNEA